MSEGLNIATADLSQPQQLNFLSLLNAELDKVEGLKAKKKEQKEKLESELLQDDNYSEATETVKKYSEIKKAAKKRMMVTAICQELNEAMKETTKDLKEANSDVSLAAISLKKSGTNEFVRNGSQFFIGQLAKIKKLRKKKSGFKIL